MSTFVKDIKPEYMGEIVKLVAGLKERNIAFQVKWLCNGFQVVCDGWDAICHDYSYGHEQGLLEVMGTVCRDGIDDEVEGYLTAEAVLARLQ